MVKKINLLNLSFLFFALFLNSCGFKSPYKNQDLIQNKNLNSIEIEPINSIEGAEFYHHLSNLLPKSYNTRYILKVQFSTRDSPLVIQKNADILRQTISQLIKYQLFDKMTSKELISGQFRLLSSYNAASSSYITYTESEKTLENLTKLAAEEIRTRLILYFETNKNNEILPISN